MECVIKRFSEVARDFGLSMLVVLDRFGPIKPSGGDIIQIIVASAIKAAVSRESIVSRMWSLFQSIITSLCFDNSNGASRLVRDRAGEGPHQARRPRYSSLMTPSPW